MTLEEKAAAFDLLALAFTSRQYDGRWRWFTLSPCGGESRTRRTEAVADLVEYARRVAHHRDHLYVTRVALPVVSPEGD